MESSFREQVSYSLLFKSTAFAILLADSVHYSIGLACIPCGISFSSERLCCFLVLPKQIVLIMLYYYL